MKNKGAGKFVKELYDKFNDTGIERIAHYADLKGYTVVDKEEDYKVDIIAHKEGKERRVEVEMLNKKFTCAKDFEYDNVSFLGRKEKFAKDGAFWYILLSHHSDHFIACYSSFIYQEKYKKEIFINSPYRKGMDTFYRVPKEYCYFIDMSN